MAIFNNSLQLFYSIFFPFSTLYVCVVFVIKKQIIAENFYGAATVRLLFIRQLPLSQRDLLQGFPPPASLTAALSVVS